MERKQRGDLPMLAWQGGDHCAHPCCERGEPTQQLLGGVQEVVTLYGCSMVKCRSEEVGGTRKFKVLDFGAGQVLV